MNYAERDGREVESSKEGSPREGSDQNLASRRVKDGELTENLHLTMRQAEEAAKTASECSKSVAEVADRWRSHREKLNQTPTRVRRKPST